MLEPAGLDREHQPPWAGAMVADNLAVNLEATAPAAASCRGPIALMDGAQGQIGAGLDVQGLFALLGKDPAHAARVLTQVRSYFCKVQGPPDSCS